MSTYGSLIVAIVSCGPASSATAQDSPNIIYVMVDDLGYGDLGCYGNERIATPCLDRMAAEGMRFTDFYAGASWCMPSRTALMTGKHPYRPGKMIPNVAASFILPQLLGERGYATALIGKWHLGMGEGSHPLDKGFDSFYGTPGSNDVPPPKGKRQVYEVFRDAAEEDWPVSMFRGREMIEKPARQSLFTKRYTSEAIRFIRANKDRPFFLYLAHNMPHAPLFASEQFEGKSKGGIFGDVVEEIDWSMGQILEALKVEGLDEKTLVVFTSDNGPWTMFKEFGGTAKPLRGEKSTTWEGGPRVPAIFRWPGKIEPSVCPEFMVNVDVYATVAAMTGAAIRAGEALDSLDMSGVLFGGEQSPRKSYLFFTSRPLAYRSGDYKIHFGSKKRSRDPDTFAGEPTTMYDTPLLFNLKADVSETTDLASQQPEILARLIREYHARVEKITGKKKEQ